MVKQLPPEIRLRGASICSGIAIGIPFLYTFTPKNIPDITVDPEEIPLEVNRYLEALDASEREVWNLRKKLDEDGASDAAAILDSHLQMMRDPLFTNDIEKRIRFTSKKTEYVFQQAIGEIEARFERIPDPYLRERVTDFHDVAGRILRRLNAETAISLSQVPKGSIVFAQQLVPSDMVEAESSLVSAFVTLKGGDTSHAAIMVRAKGIPYVARVDFSQVQEFPFSPVIVDGRTGEVILYPTFETLRKYERLKNEHGILLQRFEKEGHLPAETLDGYRISLSANVESFSELGLVQQYGATGIGLFRSEYICLSRGKFPSEEEQYKIYQRVVESVPDRPVVLRTFDVGGDKFKSQLQTQDEHNPFLGCRAIRYMLKEPEVFIKQLKAMLRAAAHGDVRILFPMISGLMELRKARSYVEEAKQELIKEGKPFGEQAQIGCMIEVPSAAITVDMLAEECDFLSIGTNDLVQYALAVDRDNQAMSYLYTPAHPSVLRLIRMVVEVGKKRGIPVTLCGEVAADRLFTGLLLGLGIDELSIAVRYHLPKIKHVIRSLSIVRSCHLAEQALTLRSPHEVLELLKEEYRRVFGELALTNSVGEN